MSELTHLREDGSAHMVDVSAKTVTARRAVAQAVLVTRAEVVSAVLAGDLPKGEAIGTARIAGIMAAKQTSALIPLCHPLPLSSITVDITGAGSSLTVVATVATTAVTGVEMEALTAASVAALTLYDMVKAVDRAAVIGDIRVVEKQGGKSGDWSAADPAASPVMAAASPVTPAAPPVTSSASPVIPAASPVTPSASPMTPSASPVMPSGSSSTPSAGS